MRTVILFLLGILPIFSFAGVIMTTNGERIEDVTIQRETSESIVYVENGIEKTISIEQVQAVLFDNGNFKEYPKYTSVVVNEPAVTTNENIRHTTQNTRRQVQPKVPKEPKVPKFDPDGKKCRLSGWITGGVGISCMLAGAILVGIGGEEYTTTYPSGNTVYYYDDTLPITGSALLSVGAGATAVSIPLLVVGITRKYRSANLSEETAQSYMLELQAQKNQIGLALKF